MISPAAMHRQGPLLQVLALATALLLLRNRPPPTLPSPTNAMQLRDETTPLIVRPTMQTRRRTLLTGAAAVTLGRPLLARGAEAPTLRFGPQADGTRPRP